MALTTIIGKQEWMVDNLDVVTFRNGDLIPEAKTNKDWIRLSDEKKPAWCYYDNDPLNGEKYGKLYNWYAVSDGRNLAPKGYRIPHDSDWDELIRFLGGFPTSGRMLKSRSGWTPITSCGTDLHGFTALPGGKRWIDGKFMFVGENAIFWSVSCQGPDTVSQRPGTHYDIDGGAGIWPNHLDKRAGFSVRCIRQNLLMPTHTDYIEKLGTISKRVFKLANYPSYCIYEDEWKDYFDNIFLPNLNRNLCRLRIAFMESAPKVKGVSLGNPNYIFDISTRYMAIKPGSDKYIDQWYKGVCNGLGLPIATCISKACALTILAQHNILLIDILPTHGIKLSSNERSKVVKSYIGSCDLVKINNAISSSLFALIPDCTNPKLTFCFSVPPTTASATFGTILPAGFIDLGNVNIGQGHAPSRHAVSKLFKIGF